MDKKNRMASRQELFGPVHVPDDSLHVGDNAQVSITSDAVSSYAPALVW